MAPIVNVAAVIVDCADSGPMAAFYQAACGGDLIKEDDDSAWLQVSGMTSSFARSPGTARSAARWTGPSTSGPPDRSCLAGAVCEWTDMPPLAACAT
jgi:hypothetical protein